ncbi:MAG: hypothetical protein ACREOZ_05385 [Gloeomargaritales cyanobacterium]
MQVIFDGIRSNEIVGGRRHEDEKVGNQKYDMGVGAQGAFRFLSTFSYPINSKPTPQGAQQNDH